MRNLKCSRCAAATSGVRRQYVKYALNKRPEKVTYTSPICFECRDALEDNWSNYEREQSYEFHG